MTDDTTLEILRATPDRWSDVEELLGESGESGCWCQAWRGFDAKAISLGRSRPELLREACLAAAGAQVKHVIKWTVLVKEGTDIRPAFGVFQQRWGKATPPPVITVAMVAGLAGPDALAELEATAVVPE